MNALTKALDRSRAKARTVQEAALRTKAESAVLTPGPGYGLGDWTNQRGNRERYGMFRGWLYAAINALASEAAGQPFQVGRLLGAEEMEEEARRLGRWGVKSVAKMPRNVRTKALSTGWEVLPEHPLVQLLEQPNPMQGQWQFVYTFVANLCLTGWAYLVGGKGENGLELYSLPTTWVTPKHEKGPFSSFVIQNPNSVDVSSAVTLDRKSVAFAHLPNPADPLSAVAPIQTQAMAVRVDDHIQTSQERFFENGIFPSVVISIGKDPHPEVPGGLRPRLTGPQRRQVVAAIQNTMGGVANYGEPAIVDGMIESVTRLSATQNEMGWEKSETAVRTRILSSFGVHPYILGEAVNVGGYAQAAKIEERFCKRVNTFLSMLGTLITNWAAPMSDPQTRLLVWWEEAESNDPSIYWNNVMEARKLGDLTKNELRTELGFPADEEAEEIVRSRLLDSVGGMQGTAGVLSAVGMGQISREAAIAMLALFLQITEEQAAAIVGRTTVTPQPLPQPVALPSKPEEEEEEEEGEETEDNEDEMEELEGISSVLQQAVKLLGLDPQELAERTVAGLG